jgi:orotate phosphoribosyltransferase
MTAPVTPASRALIADRRTALAGDLQRAGYVRGFFTFAGGSESSTYLDKYLVLTRPGLLSRCADLLAEDLPANTDRLCARGSGAIVLATAIALRSGIPLIVPRETPGPVWEVGGEVFPGARAVLVEDVIFTGHHALRATEELRRAGVEVIGVACLVDREKGGRLRIETAGVPVDALFTERELAT